MTTLSVRVSGSEFSRYYPPLDLIKATASTDANVGTVVTFTLVREDGYGTVATKTGTVASGLATATFDLKTDCEDTGGVYRAKQGIYHVTATITGPQSANSSSFYIMIVSVHELKFKYLRGVSLLAADIVQAQNAPFAALPGIEIVNTSETQFKGIFILAWGGTGTPTLSWDGGVASTIDMAQSAMNVVLVNSKRNAYIEVLVTPPDLPAGIVNQDVILDSAEVEDDVLRSFLIDAYQDIQGRLFVALEPSTFDSDRPTDAGYDATTPFADEYTDPLSYYRDSQFPADKFLSLRFPHPWILHSGVKRLQFFFNSSKVATINVTDWVVNMTRANSGLVEFVPKVAATLIFTWFATPALAFLTRWSTVPSAWHYRLDAGLPDLSKDGRGRVRVAVARRAAIEALVLAGLAAAPGYTSESTSKDGVSQSRSYASGPGGMYSQIIQQHQLFLFGPSGNSGEILKLRQKLLGLYGVTI